MNIPIKYHVLVFFVFVGIFSLFYQIGAMSQISASDASNILKEFETLVYDTDALGIFANNIVLALPMFIPGLGAIWGLYSGWSTGFTFAAIASTTPALSDFPPLAILYTSPFGLMELTAYSLGISRSCLLVFVFVKKIGIKTQLLPTSIEIVIAVVLLLVGGFLEFSMINAGNNVITNVADL